MKKLNIKAITLLAVLLLVAGGAGRNNITSSLSSSTSTNIEKCTSGRTGTADVLFDTFIAFTHLY